MMIKRSGEEGQVYLETLNRQIRVLGEGPAQPDDLSK